MPTTRQKPPADYEALIRLIHDRYDVMSKTYQKISVYLTQNPNEIAVHSIHAIADRCGIHASSFVRFAQSLGYTGFKDLQSLFQKRLETAAPGFEARVRALDDDLENRDDPSDIGFLRELVVKDIASLQELLEDTSADDLAAAADLLLAADTVFLLGQLRSAPVVEFLRYMLTMIGKRCVLLDPSGGLATHMARRMTEPDVLLAVSFRYYANEVVSIVEDVGQTGRPVIAISDSTLSPLAKSASVLFAVPEHRHTFSRSLAAPMCIAQALVLATAARAQGGDDSPRIPTVTEN
ncbi:MAG: MurR/RpiR family transcriptional regulator [Hyphomicrobiales bacterium]|nr:MurR/RpiR family transcriptional regulator [Hyphomicrobiales bacterium]MCP4998810.1 MurR/RpiR family transcriptional regulator [Hyphomicrobiales bacterium]